MATRSGADILRVCENAPVGVPLATMAWEERLGVDAILAIFKICQGTRVEHAKFKKRLPLASALDTSA